MDDEAAWYSLPTLLTTMPVAVGIIAAPKKRRHQSMGIMYTMLFRKPMGAANTKAMVPKEAQSLTAVSTFFPLYPP